MIDLHLHLDGSLTPEDILHLGQMDSIPLPCRDAEGLRPLLEVAPGCRNLGEYLEKFDLPLQVLQTEEALEYAVSSVVQRLAEQKLYYAEIRFAPQLHLAKGLTQEQAVAAAAKGLEEGIEKSGMPAQLILCCMRGADNREANLETVRVAKAYLGKGVCAVDLAGNEAAYPTEAFAPIFVSARELDVPIIIHAGEAAGAESVRQALALGARRIGHGIRSMEDKELPGALKASQIPLEICYTSNLQTKAWTDGEYPLKALAEAGVRVTVNTDNMTVSGTTLRNEYMALREQLGLSDNVLLQLACNSADATFLPREERALLKQHITKDFNCWLNG